MIYPFEVRTLTTDAYEMEYIVFGEGKTPFVMIPGVSMSSVIFSAEFIAAAYARFGDGVPRPRTDLPLRYG